MAPNLCSPYYEDGTYAALTMYYEDGTYAALTMRMACISDLT